GPSSRNRGRSRNRGQLIASTQLLLLCWKLSTFSATHKARELKFNHLENITFTLNLCRAALIQGAMIDLMMLFFAAVHNRFRPTPDCLPRIPSPRSWATATIDRCSGSTLAFPRRTFRLGGYRQEGQRLGRYIFDRVRSRVSQVPPSGYCPMERM